MKLLTIIPKMSKMAIMLMLLLMMTAVLEGAPLAIGTKGIYLTRLQQNSAIYLDNIGKMDVVRSNWKLIVYYDLDPFFKEMQGINNLTTQLERQ